MYQIESVFIGESQSNRLQTEIKFETRSENKVGDIIRLAPNQFTLNCTQCSSTFHHFTEFTLHIEDHFMQNDTFILHNINIKDENFIHSDIKFNETIVPVELISECQFDIECELEQKIPSNENANKITDEDGKCDGPHQRAASKTFKSKNNLKIHLVEHGKEKNVFCPICMKGFNTVHYLQKHIKSIHKQTISSKEIRKAQTTLKQIVRPKKYDQNSINQSADDATIAATAAAIAPDQMPNVKLNVLSSNYWRCKGKKYHCLLCVKWFTIPKYVQKHIRIVHGRQMSIDEIVAAQIQSELKPDQTATVEMVQQKQIESLQRQQAAASSGNRVESFECFLCHRMFKTMKALNVHFPLHEGIQYACPLCDKYFSMQKYVRDHMIYRHGFDKKSKLPPLKWRKIENFEYHRPIISRFECYLCHRTYPTRSKLVSHGKTHTEIISCSICAKIFKSHESRRRHMQLHLADPNRLHHCLICNKEFAVRRYLTSHMRTSHPNASIETTVTKTKKLSSSSSSVQNQKSQIQTCAICQKVFEKPGTFNKHMKCHSKEPTRYICDCCGYEFNNRHLLRKHLSTVHKINRKHFKCNLCQKVVLIKREEEHLKWHRGEKDHQCEICGTQYATAGLLKTHKKRQHNDQTYKCDVCFVDFGQPRKLLIHRRTHSEPMDIQCRYCQLGFSTARSLRKHRMKKHADQFDYTFASCDSDCDIDTIKIESSF